LSCDIREERVEDEWSGCWFDSPKIGDLREDGRVIVDPFLLVASLCHPVDRLLHDLPKRLQLLPLQNLPQFDKPASLKLLYLFLL
jgi:hypothetical protein